MGCWAPLLGAISSAHASGSAGNGREHFERLWRTASQGTEKTGKGRCSTALPGLTTQQLAGTRTICQAHTKQLAGTHTHNSLAYDSLHWPPQAPIRSKPPSRPSSSTTWRGARSRAQRQPQKPPFWSRMDPSWQDGTGTVQEETRRAGMTVTNTVTLGRIGAASFHPFIVAARTHDDTVRRSTQGYCNGSASRGCPCPSPSVAE